MAAINYPEAIRVSKEKLNEFGEMLQSMLKRIASETSNYTPALEHIAKTALNIDDEQRQLDKRLREFEGSLPQSIKRELEGFPPTTEPTPEEAAPPAPKSIGTGQSTP